MPWTAIEPQKKKTSRKTAIVKARSHGNDAAWCTAVICTEDGQGFYFSV